MNSKPLEDLIAADWAHALEPQLPLIKQIGERLRAEVAAERDFLPPASQIFRAFETPLERVRVLLLGQDPYPTPGHAMGLSFSVSPGVAPPRSLQNIFRELVSDLGVPPPSSGDLSPWAEQGVLLLNRTLTVQPGVPNSHLGFGWARVTDAAVSALARRGGPLVAILWGRQAQSAEALLPHVPVVKSAHPSPLSASRGFFGSRPFSKANEYLLAQGAAPINWELP